MRNKKGFTLIELLAVIVILAIIALIATPMIMDVIDKARKGAVENSALGYVEGIEKYAVYGMIEQGGQISFNEGVYDVKDAALTGIEYKGDMPSSGWVAVDAKGNVKAAYLKFASYGGYVGYTNKDHAQAILTDTTFSSETIKETDGNPATITVSNAESKVSTALAAART